MHRNRVLLEQRIERTLRERIQPAIFEPLRKLDVAIWRVPAEQPSVVGEPVPYSQVKWDEFTPTREGEPWGSAWETVWFRFATTIPSASDLPELAKLPLSSTDVLEARVDLGWKQHSPGFQAEGLVRDSNGRTIKAINPFNTWIPVPQPQPSEPQDLSFSVEAAANPILLDVPPFQPNFEGDKLTASRKPIYSLAQAELGIRREAVYQLSLDIAVIYELIHARTELDAFGWKALAALSDALDALDLTDIPSTAEAARAILAPILATPAHSGALTLSAVGHAHIDSAWLWPIRETRRKVNRTLANVIRLIEDGQPITFAFPAAQHMVWLEEDDPELFERVKAAVKAGKIIPVGGMWIETDAILPSGEAMARQLIEGLDYIERTFGVTCHELWLPDSFGYSASLPQIAAEAGIHRFLTQKISWNETNTFPHHTLAWEGLDGTRIFTHFPPADTYGSDLSGDQVLHAADNFKDRDRASVELLPYGYGDGGGGPTREMLERMTRMEDFALSPRVVPDTPQRFFEAAEAEAAERNALPVWVGELYLERHRGTLTSQIQMKTENRACEALLREAELWCATAAARGLIDYPYDELRTAWHSLLLSNFHDILPGTSVAWVYREVAELHQQIRETCERWISRALEALAGDGATTSDAESTLLVNATSFARGGVPALGSAPAPTPETEPAAPAEQLALDETEEGAVTITNGTLELEFNTRGECTALRDGQGINYVPSEAAAGTFQIYQDFPAMWDAWDIDPTFRGSEREIAFESVSTQREAGKVSVSAQAHVDNSLVAVTWSLTQGAPYVDLHVSVDWHDQEKLLKLAFPVAIHTHRAQYEAQFGYQTRSTHRNTSWDDSMFEVGAQRWVRLANATRSLAIINRATYGWSVQRVQRADGRSTYQRVQATLVKSARYPDPLQDQGRFEWDFRIYPGASVAQATAAGQALASPARELVGQAFEPLLRVEGAVVESVALAPDRSGDVVIRLYEALGGDSLAHVEIPGAQDVWQTDLRYRRIDGESTVRVAPTTRTEAGLDIELSPFQIVTLRATLGNEVGAGAQSAVNTNETEGEK